jgi:coenzyme PQQ precursor peptide PqqA
MASSAGPGGAFRNRALGDFKEEIMKVWMKPAVREQEVGLEVTSYLPAEIDII